MVKVARVSSVIAVSTALVCSVALPATAAESGSTLTVTINEGALAISAPVQPAAFGAVTPGLAMTKTTTMDVAVTDTRGSTLGSWAASVRLADFTGGKLGNTDTIPAEAVTYLPGDPVKEVGTVVNSLTGLLTTGSLTLSGPTTPLTLTNNDQVTRSASSIIGNNTVKWSPTLALTIPENIVADTYTATLTHSVA